MSDRKVIEGDFTARCDGIRYTRTEMILQADEWAYPGTDLKTKFLRFESEQHSGGTRRFIILQLPDGSEYSSALRCWLRGIRPTLLRMDRHILAQEVGDLPGVEFIEFGKNRHGNPIIKFRLPSGEVSSIMVNDWRKGHRPALIDMQRHIIVREVEERGYQFLEWGNNERGDVIIKFLLPNGEEYSMHLGSWLRGSRPGGRVGGYCETIFSRDEELRNSPGVLYYRKFVHPTAPTVFKIGIAKGETSKNRFRERDGDYTVTVLAERQMTLYEAFLEEQRIMKEFAEFKYVPDSELRGGGNQECFSIDILGLDTESADYEWQQAA